MEKRLQRSCENCIIAGVCGGLAVYMNLDPTIVRLLFIVLTLASGGTFIAVYLLLWLIVPEKGATPTLVKPTSPSIPPKEATGETAAAAEAGANLERTSPASPDEVTPEGEKPQTAPARPRRRDTTRLLGWILVGIGAYFLLSSLGLRKVLALLWPVLLIAVGLILLWPHLQGNRRR